MKMELVELQALDKTDESSERYIAALNRNANAPDTREIRLAKFLASVPLSVGSRALRRAAR